MTWIDLESPSRDEIASVAETYALPPLVVEELASPLFRSKVDRYEHFLYLVLHFPIIQKNRQIKFEQEIDFVVGKNFIITAHAEPIDALYEFSKEFEINSTLDKGISGSHAGFLFFLLIKEMYAHIAIELDTLGTSLRDIEKSIFNGKESEMVSALSGLNRNLVDFKQSLRFHHETLSSFERAGVDFFGKEFAYQLDAITGEYRKVQKILEDTGEIVRDLRETNDSLLTSKTNDIITKLTIVNFIMLPLGLVTWIFAMPSEVIFIKDARDFFLVLVAMFLIAVALVIYFKNKKWL